MRAASAGDRVRACRRAAAQGQGRPGAGLAGAARRRPARRPRSVGPARAAVRRPRRGAAASSRTALDAAGRDRRARLVSITGPGGIGKSRLAWELEKYIDGVAETIYWHRGRSPAYGDGITFWALGEMVRRRAGLAEADDEATTRAAHRDDASPSTSPTPTTGAGSSRRS